MFTVKHLVLPTTMLKTMPMHFRLLANVLNELTISALLHRYLMMLNRRVTTSTKFTALWVPTLKSHLMYAK